MFLLTFLVVLTILNIVFDCFNIIGKICSGFNVTNDS